MLSLRLKFSQHKKGKKLLPTYLARIFFRMAMGKSHTKGGRRPLEKGRKRGKIKDVRIMCRKRKKRAFVNNITKRVSIIKGALLRREDLYLSVSYYNRERFLTF